MRAPAAGGVQAQSGSCLLQAGYSNGACPIGETKEAVRNKRKVCSQHKDIEA